MLSKRNKSTSVRSQKTSLRPWQAVTTISLAKHIVHRVVEFRKCQLLLRACTFNCYKYFTMVLNTFVYTRTRARVHGRKWCINARNFTAIEGELGSIYLTLCHALPRFKARWRQWFEQCNNLTITYCSSPWV